MAAKSDAIVKLVLVFVISLLSFAVGTFVGKKYSDQQHKIAAYEPTKESTSDRSVASEKEVNKAGAMSDEEIAKLAEEFVTDESDSKEAKPEVAKTEEARTPAAAIVKAPDTAHTESAHQQAATSAVHNEVAPGQPMKVAQSIVEGKHAVEAKPALAPAKGPRLPAALPQNVAQYPVGKFTVQVASFSSEDDAKKRAEDLKNKGYSAFYLPAKVNGQNWFRVSVGQFPTENEAKSYRSEFMQKSKIESAIIQKMTN